MKALTALARACVCGPLFLIIAVLAVLNMGLFKVYEWLAGESS